MALVLNATKEFCSDKMIPDSGGGRQLSGTESLTDREQGTHKCSFCSGTFSTLYHLQCHNIYKHSSILKSKDNMLVESQPLDLKTVHPSNVKNNEDITLSESGALDLSTVRSRQVFKSTSDCENVSSSLNVEADESDCEEEDKLVIDTQEDNNREEESSPNHSSQENGRLEQNSLQNRVDLQHGNTYPFYSSSIQNLQTHPEHFSRDQRIFRSGIPSSNFHSVDHQSRSPHDHQSRSPQDVNTHLNQHAKPSNLNNYQSPYNSTTENKHPNVGNHSLLNIIPPMQSMGMMGNFPMPFGLNPFMMMPPNSFMTPNIAGNFPENRVLPPNDMVSPSFSTNLNCQQTKSGAVRRNSVSKPPRSSGKSSSSKQKDVVEIYECKTCKRRFSQVGNFHNHMKTHESKVCACGLCEMEFSDSYELQRHMRNTHTGSMPYKCEQCDREFSQYNNLRRHLRVHNGKNYKCHLCGRTFNEIFYLEMHMGSHTGERTYKCGVCNAIFSDNAELQKHVSTHSAEELHTCDVCGKSFSKACVLRQHKKMHSGVRPFKCEVCDKSFIHRHHLTIHSRMHSTNKPYVCKICKKEFSQTSHLYKHIRQHTEQPGVTEAMIHESLAPILEKLKHSSDSPISSPSVDSSDERLSDAINNNVNHNTSKERAVTPDSTQITVEKEMSPTDTEVREINENHQGSKIERGCDETSRHIIADGLNVQQMVEKSFKEMHSLVTGHEGVQSKGDNLNDFDEKKSEISEFDDTASDKASVISAKSYLNSPHSGFPYDNQCLKESFFPENESEACNDHNCLHQDHDANTKCCTEQESKASDRYSPISQSSDNLSEKDFRPRVNSANENLVTKPHAPVSPRILTSENVLKEQHIPQDNCTDHDSNKTELIMPPKKRRRYTQRQKKKSVEVTENQPLEKPNYQQMIQPIAPEAQQMYFLQLQQMQMALAANVMAAQGMMMQNASEQMKNLPYENQRGVPNGSNDIPFFGHPQGGTPLKGGLPFPVNMTKDLGPLEIPRGPPFTNGSLFNHSIAKAGYL